MESRKWIRLVLSIAISIALWVYVINVVNPSSTITVRNIPVTLTGTDILYGKNLAIEGKGEYTVDITVRASRSDLSTLSVDNIVATADVSELTLGQDYITVSVSISREYTVEDIRSRKILVYVDELAVKTVPVRIEYSGTQKAGYEAAAVSVSPEYVEVYGAKKLVDMAAAYVVDVDTTKLEYETLKQLELTGQTLDSSGNALGVISDTEVVTVSAATFPTKTVKLKTGYYGEPWAGASINRITVPETVTVKGAMDKLSEVTEVYAEEIDIEGIYGDAEFDIIPVLPEGVYLSEADKDIKLVIDLADTGSIDFHYYPYDVITLNLADNLYASYSLQDEGYITATVTGPISTLRTMSSSDVTLSIDGSKLVIGTSSVKMTAGSQISGVSISLSPQTVSVYVREK